MNRLLSLDVDILTARNLICPPYFRGAKMTKTYCSSNPYAQRYICMVSLYFVSAAIRAWPSNTLTRNAGVILKEEAGFTFTFIPAICVAAVLT